ncbi:DNA-binding protein [Burkholderia pseudomallei]|uniref:helix-turn-helix domain-containing protein n=1 Tax=Burkholderia pseudomallei TaxID=28450 RepID=UPI00050F1B40|nr:helix-turn-helix transcriptional regulator [Burkholderia pseudomallei]KGC70211.1 DNA-binding protein [Burkholderia pseudomallei]
MPHRTIPIRDPRYVRLRKQLHALRIQAGLTQVELAARLRIDQSNLSKIERGERYLDTLAYVDWCRACGVEPTDALQQLLELDG